MQVDQRSEVTFVSRAPKRDAVSCRAMVERPLQVRSSQKPVAKPIIGQAGRKPTQVLPKSGASANRVLIREI